LAEVAITFNKRTFRFQCGEDEAQRLEQLANYLKGKIQALTIEHGPIGDERLVLMAALMLADELFEARADIDDLLDDQTGKLKDVVAEGKARSLTKALSDAMDDDILKASR
jgi:cell division protein ZapA